MGRILRLKYRIALALTISLRLGIGIPSPNPDYSTISLFPSGKPYKDVGEGLAQYPPIAYGSGETAEKIKRGEYLVKLGDCIGCHTKKDGKPFAGGLGFDTPFGKIYSPNITPDKNTGIGKWSQKQFFRAVKQGIAPHHTYLYPAFPYLYFRKIDDKDLDDMKAYLDAVPAVQQKNLKNKMIFPFNFRFLQIGWRLLFFYFQAPDAYRNKQHHDPIWNRGAYLVQSLGHCDMCHTPMYYLISKQLMLGAPIRKYHMTGAFVSGFYAPNVTGLFLDQVNLAAFQNIFWQHTTVEGRTVEGPMEQAIHDSLEYLTSDDVNAIYIYLKSLNSLVPPKPADGENLGREIYDRYCRQCHQNGKGPIPGAPRIQDQGQWQILLSLGKDQLYHSAFTGFDGMPIRGTCMDCSADEIKLAVQYLLTESIPEFYFYPTNTQQGKY